MYVFEFSKRYVASKGVGFEVNGSTRRGPYTRSSKKVESKPKEERAREA